MRHALFQRALSSARSADITSSDLRDRQRGVAGALTTRITERVIAAGAACAWLAASEEKSWRVYQRVGYAPTGKRRHLAHD
ncbi:hypothetical protein K7640_01240 [Micromonospora sp. PLK6-60]|uniref:hypothetical protein n=1 Tax=Micromonospora sp. PLK6-60 TaxID=2873383 RepID=UPI001CA649C8|nr:hypothetical protein [Micromonospora sp. PLK6-60]MBY8870464.1 hypothetical protein [Micromonospora sp. PLK6-60]